MAVIESILWFIGLGVLSMIGVTGWFFAYAHAMMLQKQNINFSRTIKIPLYIYLYAGVTMDVLFNVIVGSIIFREIPREWLFTTRVQRHVTADDWRRGKAYNWAQKLNKVDPGHVKL